MKILITGGAGFIGSNLAAYYLNHHHQVTIFDNLSRAHVDTNLAWLKTITTGKLELISQDIRNLDAINHAVKHQDVIFHQAAQAIIATSVTHPRYDFEVNLAGTFNLLESIRLDNPEAILFHSASLLTPGPVSPLTCSQQAARQYVELYHQTFNLRTVIFDQATIYGDRQLGIDEQDWIAYCISHCLTHTPIVLSADTNHTSDVLYIDDLVQAYDRALQSIETTSGQIFSLGGGQHHLLSPLELILELEKLSHTKLNYSLEPTQEASAQDRITDTSKALEYFGWEPKIGVKTGVSRLYTWISNFISTKTI